MKEELQWGIRIVWINVDNIDPEIMLVNNGGREIKKREKKMQNGRGFGVENVFARFGWT